MRSRRENGGSLDDVLPREDDHLAQGLADPIAALLLDKEPPQPFRREILRDALRVETVPGLVQQRVVEIGGEHLQLAHPRRLVRGLDERHRDGIRLLARWSSRAPRRAAASSPRCCSSAGQTLRRSTSNASGLRKKLVTLISTSE